MENNSYTIESIKSLPFLSFCHYFDEIESTNTWAKENIKTKPSNLGVVWAKRQSRGRGRFTRTFFSSVDGGLWISLVVPVETISLHFHVNRSLGLAIRKTLLKYAPSANIKLKWPNDVYWDDKKVCGVLLESTSHLSDVVIAGFGINLNIELNTFPKELHSIATSTLIETNRTLPEIEVLYKILHEFHKNFNSDEKPQHELYQKSLYKLGTKVQINKDIGMYHSVELDGTLILECNDSLKKINSGLIEFLE